MQSRSHWPLHLITLFLSHIVFFTILESSFPLCVSNQGASSIWRRAYRHHAWTSLSLQHTCHCPFLAQPECQSEGEVGRENLYDSQTFPHCPSPYSPQTWDVPPGQQYQPKVRTTNPCVYHLSPFTGMRAPIVGTFSVLLVLLQSPWVCGHSRKPPPKSLLQN